MKIDPSEKLAAFALRLQSRVDHAESKMPVKGYWKRWGLAFVALGKILKSLPAVVRGRKVVREIERQ